MNSINEKEKKLNIALEELKNLDLTNPELQKNIENLSAKQNQLEIEKTQIEEKYKTLLEEHENLSKKLEDLKSKEKLEERKQVEFSENVVRYQTSLTFLNNRISGLLSAIKGE